MLGYRGDIAAGSLQWGHARRAWRAEQLVRAMPRGNGLQWGHARRAWRARGDFERNPTLRHFNGALAGGHCGPHGSTRLRVGGLHFNGAMPGGHGGHDHDDSTDGLIGHFNGAMPGGHGGPPASQTPRTQGFASPISRGGKMLALNSSFQFRDPHRLFAGL